MTNAFIVYARRVLIVAICILFILFLTADLYHYQFQVSSSLIKFICIFLCFLISIISSPLRRQSKNIFLLHLGLIFTTMADYIFLIQNTNYSIAIGLFSIVQIIYSLRYREGNERIRILSFTIVFIMIYIVYKIINIYYEIDFLIAISAFYALCLFSSIKEALWLYRNNKNQYTSRLILLGMILFFFCDVNLGLNYILGLADIGPSLNLIKSIAYISIWIFYLPSQILLALSGWVD